MEGWKEFAQPRSSDSVKLDFCSSSPAEIIRVNQRVWLNTGTKAVVLPVWSNYSQTFSVEQSQVQGFTPFNEEKSSCVL